MSNSEELKDRLGELRQTKSEYAIRALAREAVENPRVLTVTTAFEVFHARADTYPEVVETEVEVVLSELSRQTVLELLERGVERGWRPYVKPHGTWWEGSHGAAIRGLEKLLQHTSEKLITDGSEDDGSLPFERLLSILSETKTLDFAGAHSLALSALNELGHTVASRRRVRDVLNEMLAFVELEDMEAELVAEELSDLLFGGASILDEETVLSYVERIFEWPNRTNTSLSKRIGELLATHEDSAHRDAVVEFLVPESDCSVGVGTKTASAFGMLVNGVDDDTLRTALIRKLEHRLCGDGHENTELR